MNYSETVFMVVISKDTVMMLLNCVWKYMYFGKEFVSK